MQYLPIGTGAVEFVSSQPGSGPTFEECSGPRLGLGSTFKAFLGSIRVRVPLKKIKYRSGLVPCSRAVRYDDIYRMDEIKSLSFHITFYRLFRGVGKYIVYGNTCSSFG